MPNSFATLPLLLFLREGQLLCPGNSLHCNWHHETNQQIVFRLTQLQSGLKSKLKTKFNLSK